MMMFYVWWLCASVAGLGLAHLSRHTDGWVSVSLSVARDVAVMWQGSIIWTWMQRVRP